MKKLAINLGLSLLGCTLLLSGPARADYEVGVNAALAGNYEVAFREFKAAAEDGLDLAQFNLAILYFTGRGVEQDVTEAARWTEAAAAQGHTEAQFNLGALYYNGQGVSQDKSRSAEWYSQAAKSGHGEAAYLLATMYDEGDGVERDRVLAHAWSAMAVANEYEDAQGLMDRIERRLNARELSEARRQFARWQIDF